MAGSKKFDFKKVREQTQKRRNATMAQSDAIKAGRLQREIEEKRKQMLEDVESEVIHHGQKDILKDISHHGFNEATLTVEFSRNAMGEMVYQRSGIADDITDLELLDLFVNNVKSKLEINDLKDDIDAEKMTQFLAPVESIFASSPFSRSAELHGRLAACAKELVRPGKNCICTSVRTLDGYLLVRIEDVNLASAKPIRQVIEDTLAAKLQNHNGNYTKDEEAYLELKYQAVYKKDKPQAATTTHKSVVPESSSQGCGKPVKISPEEPEEDEDALIEADMAAVFQEGDGDDLFGEAPEQQQGVADDAKFDSLLTIALDEDEDDLASLFGEGPEENSAAAGEDEMESAIQLALDEDDDISLFGDFTEPEQMDAPGTPRGTKRKADDQTAVDGSPTKKIRPLQPAKPTRQDGKTIFAPGSLPTPAPSEKSRSPSEAARSRQSSTSSGLALPPLRAKVPENQLQCSRAEPEHLSNQEQEAALKQQLTKAQQGRKTTVFHQGLIPTPTNDGAGQEYGGRSVSIDDAYGTFNLQANATVGVNATKPKPKTRPQNKEEKKQTAKAEMKGEPSQNEGEKKVRGEPDVVVPTEEEVEQALLAKDLRRFQKRQYYFFLNKYSGKGTIKMKENVDKFHAYVGGWHVGYLQQKERERMANEAAAKAQQTSPVPSVAAQASLPAMALPQARSSGEAGSSRPAKTSAPGRPGRQPVYAATDLRHAQAAGISKVPAKRSSGINKQRLAAACQPSQPHSAGLQQSGAPLAKPREVIDLSGDDDEQVPQQQNLAHPQVSHAPAYPNQQEKKFLRDENDHYFPQSPDLQGIEERAETIHQPAQVMQAPQPTTGMGRMPGYSPMRNASANRPGASRTQKHTNNASLRRVQTGGIRKAGRLSPRHAKSRNTSTTAQAAELAQPQQDNQFSFDDFAREMDPSFANQYNMGYAQPAYPVINAGSQAALGGNHANNYRMEVSQPADTMSNAGSQTGVGGNAFSMPAYDNGARAPTGPLPGFASYGNIPGHETYGGMPYLAQQDANGLNADFDGGMYGPPAGYSHAQN